MSKLKKKKLKAKAQEIRKKLQALMAEIYSDPELYAYFEQMQECIRCESIDYEEVIDGQDGLVFCCTDCPEQEDLH